MEKILTSTARIRFQDCDPFNHLNNAKYLDYFLNAREDQVKTHYDLDIFEIIRTERIGWVVASNQIAYISPVTTMDNVNIRSQLIKFSEKMLLVEMTMWDETATKLRSVLWIKFIHVDLKTQSSLRHSDKLMELFQAVLEPVPEEIFEERSMQVARANASR